MGSETGNAKSRRCDFVAAMDTFCGSLIPTQLHASVAVVSSKRKVLEAICHHCSVGSRPKRTAEDLEDQRSASACLGIG